jgi:protein-arginine kinase activator protein McsA
MTITETREVIVQNTERRTKFQQVTGGVCPHDQALLLEPVKTKGIGIKLVCSQCGHTWYINKKIKTCGCLTCKGTRRSSLERDNTRRIMRRIPENDGGPLWTRTTDPSLIRTVL